MQEADLVAKMLRAVLQSNKNGVPFSCLQKEYKSLTGDWIPFKQLGHATLEGYLKSIPEVVRIETNKTGEVTCHAVVCQETARIAQLVARQRTSKKKSGRQVHCSIRQKKIALLASVGKPKGTLRKPGIANFAEERKNLAFPPLRSKGNCSVVRPNMSSVQYPLSSTFENAPKEVLIQGHMTVMNRAERRLTVPPQLQRELQVHMSRSLSLDLNDMLLKNVKETRHAVKSAFPYPSSMDIVKVQNRIKEILSQWSSGICLSKMPYLYREAYGEELNTALLSQLEFWPHVCVVEKVYSGVLGNIFLYPATKAQHSSKGVLNQGGKSEPPSMGQTAEAKVVPSQEGFKQKIAAILAKYSSGLWADALPKVYGDTYKEMLPQDLLNNLDALSDICSVDYISGNPKKAILYAKSKLYTDENQNVTSKTHEHDNVKAPVFQPPTVIKQESQEVFVENVKVPPLIIPAETSPSVLVVELSSTNEVVIRYVGKDYSAAQELMEDEMKDWYTHHPSVLETQPKLGQLVAALAVDDAWLRAQVVSIEDNKIKVYYVDYGFSDRLENTRIYKLAKCFYSLPFQASKCKLAGLEAFCNDSAMVKTVESQTCGKIFAVEILEKSDIPLVVLYDTSGEDDININTTCLNAFRDKSLELHLQEKTLYTNVRVTNVCSDGTLYCQVPSRGLTRLCEVLQKLENYLQHKQSTEYSVSLPYCGKICLLNCKGQWARVEITCVHSSRTLDVQFMDTGTVASVKVVELREIPSTFLREIITIPPQATKCCLADLPLNIGMWTPDAVLWLRDTVLNYPDCSIKVVKLDKKVAHVYLYTPKKSPNPNHSINRQITNADLWKHQKDVFLSAFPSSFLPGPGEGDVPKVASLNAERSFTDLAASAPEPSDVGSTLKMPPPLSLPGPQEHMDVFISLACHPGYFVLQPWQEMHNLEILMEDMLLCYSGSDGGTTTVEKNKLYAAKVNNKWHRVLIKGILANGLVSVYELDYGKHELVGIQNVRPLLDLFRRLPFQAITAQLAGVDCQQWSEEASVVFRNHVENKPLVAQVQAVTDGANLWDRKVMVYLVDTSLPDTDIWIHDIMTQYCMEISKAT